MLEIKAKHKKDLAEQQAQLKEEVLKTKQAQTMVELADADSIELKLKEMEVPITKTALNRYMVKQEKVRLILKQIDFEVNTN